MAGDVQVNTIVGADGNTYTQSVINDKLTNDDFLKIYLEQLKSQDPTKPMDANQMLDNQLKMSQIESNNDMMTTLKELSEAYKTTILTNAANMIGKIVQNSEIGENGENLTYKVAAVENQDGKLVLISNKVTGIDDDNNPILDSEYTKLPIDSILKIY